jgi:hypothetical protein
MTVGPTPYEILRAIQEQQRATDRLVQMLAGMLDKSAPEALLSDAPPSGFKFAPILALDEATNLPSAAEFVVTAAAEATIAPASPSGLVKKLPETADEAAGFDSRSLAEDRCDDGSNPSAAAYPGAVAAPGGAGRPDGGERPAPFIPIEHAAVFDAMGIVAIDTHSHVIRGPKGDWQASAPVARTIARINAEGLFGIDVLLDAGPWPGADSFRARLPSIVAGLASIGVALREVKGIGFGISIKEPA